MDGALGAFALLRRWGEHTCALTVSGQAYRWGSNSLCQLGIGSSGDREIATAVAEGLLFRSISAGSYHTCGIATSGKAYCWGANDKGQLGDGTVSTQALPVLVRIP